MLNELKIQLGMTIYFLIYCTVAVFPKIEILLLIKDSISIVKRKIFRCQCATNRKSYEKIKLNELNKFHWNLDLWNFFWCQSNNILNVIFFFTWLILKFVRFSDIGTIKISCVPLKFLFVVQTQNYSRMYFICIIIEFKFLYRSLCKYIPNIVENYWIWVKQFNPVECNFQE